MSNLYHYLPDNNCEMSTLLKIMVFIGVIICAPYSSYAQWTGSVYSSYSLGYGYGNLWFGMGSYGGYGSGLGYGYYSPYLWGWSNYPGDFIYEPVPGIYRTSAIPMIEQEIEYKRQVYYGLIKKQEKPEALPSPQRVIPEIKIIPHENRIEIIDNSRTESRNDKPSPQESVVTDGGTVTINTY